MTTPRILINCIRMHRTGDRALSGNFYHCLRLIEALERTQKLALHVHVDSRTHPLIAPLIPEERLIIEDRRVDSIMDMERSIRKAVQGLRPDLYHKPTGQLPLLPTSSRAIWGVADLGYRHLQMGRLQRLYKHLSYRTSAKKAVRIITVSNSTRQEVIEALSVPPQKVQTVYHGTTSFREEVACIPDLPDTYAMTFAHHRHKNVEKAIEAVALAGHQGLNVHLAVVGSLNNRAELDQVAQDHKVTNKVMYTDHVSNGQLRYLYENALCLLFLSRHEGFGLPILEAMAAECPVISSNAFALPEVVGDSAPLFDCDDAAGVAAEMLQFAHHPGRRQSAIERGKINAQRFSWQKAAEQTIAIYESAL